MPLRCRCRHGHIALHDVQPLSLTVACSMSVIVDGEQLAVVGQVVDAEVVPRRGDERAYRYGVVHGWAETYQAGDDEG